MTEFSSYASLVQNAEPPVPPAKHTDGRRNISRQTIAALRLPITARVLYPRNSNSRLPRSPSILVTRGLVPFGILGFRHISQCTNGVRVPHLSRLVKQLKSHGLTILYSTASTVPAARTSHRAEAPGSTAKRWSSSISSVTGGKRHCWSSQQCHPKLDCPS